MWIGRQWAMLSIVIHLDQSLKSGFLRKLEKSLTIIFFHEGPCLLLLQFMVLSALLELEQECCWRFGLTKRLKRMVESFGRWTNSESNYSDIHSWLSYYKISNSSYYYVRSNEKFLLSPLALCDLQ